MAGSVPHVLETGREDYGELFSSNPEARAWFAEVITGGDMGLLSECVDGQPFNRKTEYEIGWQLTPDRGVPGPMEQSG